MTNEENQPNSEEKSRKLFIPDVEPELDDSPKNDRPADLDNLTDPPKETGKVRKPIEIDQLTEKDDPRSPKNDRDG